jgi:hypothetical protein
MPKNWSGSGEEVGRLGREGKGEAAWQWVNAVLNLRRGPVQLPWVRYADSQPSDFASSHVTEHGAL